MNEFNERRYTTVTGKDKGNIIEMIQAKYFVPCQKPNQKQCITEKWEMVMHVLKINTGIFVTIFIFINSVTEMWYVDIVGVS